MVSSSDVPEKDGTVRRVRFAENIVGLVPDQVLEQREGVKHSGEGEG